MKNITKSITAIMAALLLSGSLFAQAPRQPKTPKPMDVSACQNSIVMKDHRASNENRDYVTLLEEDFSLMTAGTETEPDGTNLADPETWQIDPNYTHEPGWMGYYIYQAGGMCAIGQSYIAFINTPEFEMAGSVHLSFRARIQSGTQCQTIVGLCIDPVNPQIIDYDGIYMTSEWQTYEFEFSNPASLDAFIQINCYTPWLLDDLEVTRELDFTPAPNALPATHYTMEGFDANWNEVNTAEEYLVTVFKRNFYGPEQVYVEPESFEGINNDGQFINWSDPNIPEGWGLNIQAGSTREVTTDAYDGNLAICMDAVGDTIVLPSNGGRFLESNVYLKLLQYNPDTDNTELEFLGKINGEWHYIGVFIPDWNMYNGHGMEWGASNLFALWISNLYDEFALAYTGEGSTVYALDFWDYTTTQANTTEYVITDQTVPVSDLSYTVTGLNPAEDHYYYVKASNAEYGESVPSNHISCFGLCPPQNCEITDAGEGTYTANWEAHPKADAYRIHNYKVTTANADGSCVVFHEDFHKVHNGMPPETPITADNPYEFMLDEFTEQPTWIGAAVILAEGMLGGRDNEYYYGRVETPEMTLNNAETFHVKAMIYSYEGERIEFKVMSTGEVQNYDVTETGMQTIDLDFTAGPDSGRERLRIMDWVGYGFLIDDISVSQDLHAGDKTYSILSWDRIDDGTANSFVFNHLDWNYDFTDYAFDIYCIHNAFGDEYNSANSDYVETTITLDIPEHSSAMEPVGDGKYYTTDGRCLGDKLPENFHGLYIFNGKKGVKY